MKSKYNFEIIFEKLEEAKKNQSEIDNETFNTTEKVLDDIEYLKQVFQGSQDSEYGTFTRT